MNTIECTYGTTIYWKAVDKPTVTPQFRIGTVTPIGKIVKVFRGAYMDSELHTIMYACEGGMISEVDLLDLLPPTGADAQLGYIARWYMDGTFKTVTVHTIGYNPYEFSFEGDVMVSPVAVYLTWQGEGNSSAFWETI